MKRHIFILLLSALPVAQAGTPEGVLVEAESFRDKGGWVVDQQFMDAMGSPYLMAHGMGVPVDDARTTADIPAPGRYDVYVRTYNWTAPWSNGKGPGSFSVSINGKKLPSVLGNTGKAWEWQKAGSVSVPAGEAAIALHDLSGFNGRCDAVYLTRGRRPPNDAQALKEFRKKHGSVRPEREAGQFDLVVSGGGIAGMCAAVSAARQGLKVALINDRPVLGGNNSSEIRVHLGGHINKGPYPELGNMIKEFGPVRAGNAQPAGFYEDGKKQRWIEQESNVTLFPSFRVDAVSMEGSRIRAVAAQHIETGERLSFRAPLFADCTGDGTVGALAGADFSVGRESRAEFREPSAPDKADSLVMGTSIQWYSEEEGESSSFPEFSYGVPFTRKNAVDTFKGDWDWETGMNMDQIKSAEMIRDYGLLVVYSNWSFLKNHLKDNGKFRNRRLAWVAYVAGKRESRRLLGDLVLTENDIRQGKRYPDGTAASTWSIDLHYPLEKNGKAFPFSAFLSISRHIRIAPYPIPYRCLYSRNIDNLFMAGRNISVTHVALGTVRVMRTTGMMGEVVGMAAYLCNKHRTTPRGVYRNHLDELRGLMKEGAGKKGLPNNQNYNQE